LRVNDNFHFARVLCNISDVFIHEIILIFNITFRFFFFSGDRPEKN
jgi:hypothetical protein